MRGASGTECVSEGGNRELTHEKIKSAAVRRIPPEHLLLITTMAVFDSDAHSQQSPCAHSHTQRKTKTESKKCVKKFR